MVPPFLPEEPGSKFCSRTIPCQKLGFSGDPGTMRVGPAVLNIGQIPCSITHPAFCKNHTGFFLCLFCWFAKHISEVID